MRDTRKFYFNRKGCERARLIKQNRRVREYYTRDSTGVSRFRSHALYQFSYPGRLKQYLSAVIFFTRLSAHKNNNNSFMTFEPKIVKRVQLKQKEKKCV